jgi:hypothetical protein
MAKVETILPLSNRRLSTRFSPSKTYVATCPRSRKKTVSCEPGGQAARVIGPGRRVSCDPATV